MLLLTPLDLVAGDASQDRARGGARVVVADLVADHAADDRAERGPGDAVRISRFGSVLESAFTRIPAFLARAGGGIHGVRFDDAGDAALLAVCVARVADVVAVAVVGREGR